MTTQAIRAPTEGHGKRTLSPRHAAFVQAIVSGKTLKAAAVLAGFNPQGAHNIAKKPLVKAAIQARLKRIEDATLAIREVTELTADWWRSELAYQYQRCRDASQAGDALRALELAGKHLGLLDTKVDQGGADVLSRFLGLLAQRALPAPSEPVTGLQARVLPADEQATITDTANHNAHDAQP